MCDICREITHGRPDWVQEVQAIAQDREEVRRSPNGLWAIRADSIPISLSLARRSNGSLFCSAPVAQTGNGKEIGYRHVDVCGGIGCAW